MKLSRTVTALAAGALLLIGASCIEDDPGVRDPVVEEPEPSDPDKEHPPLVPASKVDLLFVVDNSAGMRPKQELLARSVGRLLRELAEGTGDLHVGVISSSLGSMGGDVCADADRPRTNDLARLRNRGAKNEIVAGAEAGFLAFGPGGITDLGELEAATAEIIEEIGDDGCGLEAQLESMYRFLAQPDPPEHIGVGADEVVQLTGVDRVLLAQRRAFLRPDSAVVVVMLTDEDDSAVDPRSIGGRGWMYAKREFPGSAVLRPNSMNGTTAPRGTSICESDPASPDCRSCAFPGPSTDRNCTTSAVPDARGEGYDGYHARDDDALNVRFHRMKQRFGVDPQYPIARYVRALTERRVPNRDTEHDAEGNYTHEGTCQNPLFAAKLPAEGDDELCALEDGTRSPELVFFGLLAGVPNALLTPPDWRKILGADPDAYDESGIDPHMIQSVAPRPGLSGADLPLGENGGDPIHGREWNTDKQDLQYACTFDLPEPFVCTPGQPCECGPDSLGNPPVCGEDHWQVKDRAYPAPRLLRVAKGLGSQALTGSICAPDPAAGYGPVFGSLARKVARVLAE